MKKIWNWLNEGDGYDIYPSYKILIFSTILDIQIKNGGKNWNLNLFVIGYKGSLN
jgi:hypothetical protein